VGTDSISITGTVGWFRLDTIAQLRAQPGIDSNVFATVGTELGFLGDFYWKSGDVTADDGAFIIAPSDGLSGRWFKYV